MAKSTTIFEITASHVLKAPISEFTNDAKGRVFEKYVIRRLESDKSLHVTAAVIDSNTEPGKWQTVKIDVGGCEVVHFLGNKTARNVNWKKPAILVPDLSNYPDVDVFVWDPAGEVMYALQFTVTTPLKHGRRLFDMKDYCLAELWKQNIQGCGCQIQEIKMLWLLVDRSVNSSGYNNDLVVIAAELESQFPLLRGFTWA